MADRHGPLRTPLGGWVERVNGGVISAGAVVASGTDLGVDELTLDGLDGSPAVAGDGFSVVVPAGARAVKGRLRSPGDVMVLVSGNAVGSASVDVVSGEQTEGAPAAVRLGAFDFFPLEPWADKQLQPSPPKESSQLDAGSWFPTTGDRAIKIDLIEETPVVLLTGGRPPEELFGESYDSELFTPLESGQSVDTEGTVFAVPGTLAFGDDTSLPLERVFDVGVPAPMGGASFGMGVLSTPNAEVAGQSANPLVDLSTPNLLQREEAREMLRRAGVTDADEVEWLAGPERAYREGKDPDHVADLLGTDVAVESFVGVVSGIDGPWGVGVHVVRSTGEDHVIVAGVHRRAVGSVAEGGRVVRDDAERLERARGLLADAVARLETP